MTIVPITRKLDGKTAMDSLEIPAGALSIHGTQVLATGAQLNSMRYDVGQYAHGEIYFTGKADCTSITIGGVVYPCAESSDFSKGQWGHGDTGINSAGNLATAINSDPRTSLGARWQSSANSIAETTNGLVIVYALEPGVAGDVTTITVQGAGYTEPSALVTPFIGGRDPAIRESCTFIHEVSATEALLQFIEFYVPILHPVYFNITCREGEYSEDLPAYKTMTSYFYPYNEGDISTRFGVSNPDLAMNEGDKIYITVME